MVEFSVVIPVYNRERLVLRTLRSCLAQTGAEFEVIVVDDGSADRSALVVESLGDPRVRLIRREVNGGECAARNTGVAAARGEWIVALDSDDELLPGALTRMSQVAREHGERVERLGFTYRRDDGRLSPHPPLRSEIADHPTHLRRMDDRVLFDFLQCIRRATFDRVRAREWKFAGQRLYLADFAATYRTYFSSEVLGLVHLDAPARASGLVRDRGFARDAALDLSEEIDVLVSRHGEAIRRYAPKMFRRLQRAGASYDFLAGSTAQGARRCLRCLRDSPLSLDTWGQLFLGLTGPQIFAWLRGFRPAPT